MTVIGEIRMTAAPDLNQRWGWNAPAGARLAITGSVMALLFVGVNMATPIYPALQDKLDLGPFGVTITFTSYVLSLIAGLLLYGHWSDHIGRRAALFGAVHLALAGGLVFALAPSLPFLVLGRILQGAAVAAATGAASASLRELLPGRPDWAGRFTLLINAGGVAAGPLVGGLLSQLPDPTRLPFLLHAAALAAILIPLRLVRARPALAPAPGRMREALRPRRLRLAKEAKLPFWIGALTGLLSFALFGLMLSLAPAYFREIFGISSPLVLGALAAVTLAASALSQLLGRATPGSIAPALVIMGVATLGFVGAAHLGSLVGVIVASCVAGAAQGIAFRGAFNDASAAVPTAMHAQVVSLLYLVTYLGSAIPVLVLGFVAGSVGMSAAFAWFAVALMAGCVALAAVASGHYRALRRAAV